MNVLKFRGVPQTVVSDRNSKFLSHLWKSLWGIVRTKHMFSIYFYPQKNGRIEVANGTLETIICCIMRGTPTTWKIHLHLIEFEYIRSCHSYIGMYSFEARYGFNPFFH